MRPIQDTFPDATRMQFRNSYSSIYDVKVAKLNWCFHGERHTQHDMSALPMASTNETPYAIYNTMSQTKTQDDVGYKQ